MKKIGMEKIKETYKNPPWKIKQRREAPKNKTRRTHLFWQILFLILFVWAGYELAIIAWHDKYDNFHIRWLVGIAGGEIGAAVYFLFSVHLMDRITKKLQ